MSVAKTVGQHGGIEEGLEGQREGGCWILQRVNDGQCVEGVTRLRMPRLICLVQ